VCFKNGATADLTCWDPPSRSVARRRKRQGCDAAHQNTCLRR
jgi:hypothetical protein